MHHQFRRRSRISLRSTRATAFSKINAYICVDSVCIDWRRSGIISAPIRNPGEDIGHQSQRCPVQRGPRPRRGEFQEGRARQGRRQGHDGISGQRQSDSRKNGAIEGASLGQRGGREGAQWLTGDGDPLTAGLETNTSIVHMVRAAL
jgi:hypothetical protein